MIAIPNHITNIITIHSVSEQRLSEILASIKMADTFQNSIDFNKLIPMPPELNIESGSRTTKALNLYKDFLSESAALSTANQANTMSEAEYNAAVLELTEKYEKFVEHDPDLFSFGKQIYDNIQKHGASDWYDWSIQNWGSKWNSYGYDDRTPDSADNKIEFLTAWSRVEPVMKQLSERFPDAEFSYQWADEDVGSNVGEQVWQSGEITDQFIPDAQSREAYELAAEIMALDLEELGIRLPEQPTQKPSLMQTLESNRQKSRELFGDPSQTQAKEKGDTER